MTKDKINLSLVALTDNNFGYNNLKNLLIDVKYELKQG